MARGLAHDEARGELDMERLESLVSAEASAGVGIVLVEHDFPLVARIADRITVLDAGRVLASGPPDEVRALPEVRSAYLGVDA